MLSPMYEQCQMESEKRLIDKIFFFQIFRNYERISKVTRSNKKYSDDYTTDTDQAHLSSTRPN